LFFRSWDHTLCSNNVHRGFFKNVYCWKGRETKSQISIIIFSFFVFVEGHTNVISSLDVASNEKFIVSGSWDHTLCSFDMQGNSLNVYRGHTDQVEACAVSQNNKLIVSGAKAGINVN
jgi:WD40 repeat protein